MLYQKIYLKKRLDFSYKFGYNVDKFYSKGDFMQGQDEVWKDIPRLGGYYQISSRCNVRSLKCNKIKILKQRPSYSYCRTINLNSKCYWVHILIKNTFGFITPKQIEILKLANDWDYVEQETRDKDFLVKFYQKRIENNLKIV